MLPLAEHDLRRKHGQRHRRQRRDSLPGRQRRRREADRGQWRTGGRRWPRPYLRWLRQRPPRWRARLPQHPEWRWGRRLVLGWPKARRLLDQLPEGKVGLEREGTLMTSSDRTHKVESPAE